MKKLIVILIDGLDPYLLDKYIDELPNYRCMIQNGTFKKLISVIPPDSIPAWATIYTGLNPGEHGILESIDYLKIKSNTISLDNNAFIGKTFWDKISKNGDSVGIFNPFIAFPSWDVNGFMISGPVFESGHISSSDNKILEKYKIPPLGGIVNYPSTNSYRVYLEDCLKLLNEQNEIAFKLIKNENPSFFFYGNLIVDRIKHFYWKFTEQSSSFFKDAIFNTYLEFDKFLGKLKNEVNDEYNILIISDHGHQKRVTKSFNINEWLRKTGYINVKFSYKYIIEKTKNCLLSLFDTFGKVDIILKMSRFIPKIKKLKNSEYINDSTADIFVPKFAGMNPYGGICFNKDKISIELINEIKEKLMQIVDKKTGEKIIEWVKDRDEIYCGDHKSIFPNIIFKLNDDYGISLSFYTNSIIGKNHFYSRISGGHKREGVFLYSKNIKKFEEKTNVDIQEIHNIILDLFYERIE